MILKTRLAILDKKKKTKAKLFEALEIGEVLSLQYNLNGGYHSTPTITVVRDNGEKTDCYPNQLESNLKAFVVMEIPYV